MDTINYSSIERYHDGYPGEFIDEADIKEGLRFYFLISPDRNIKEWYEVIELQWDWKEQSYDVAVWNERRQKIEFISKIYVYVYGRID